MSSFLGIDDPNFRGGARPALGDVNRDGTPDLAVAAGFQGGPRVALFDGTTVVPPFLILGSANPRGFPPTFTRLVPDFYAFPGSDATSLRNGAFVAAGDVDGDGFADLIFGGGPGGAPRVFALSGARVVGGDIQAAYAVPVASFFVAGNSTDRGGVRVATVDADGDGRADVLAASGEGVQNAVQVLPGADFVVHGPNFADGRTFHPFGGDVLTNGVYVG